MTTVSAERLAKVFVEVADSLVDEFDLIEFLQMLADRVAGLADDATVGILLADPKRQLHFMAASDETTKFLELFQLREQDGPCVDAFHGGKPVINTDLTATAATARWPQFAPHAVTAGFRSVHAFPLRLRQEIIGVMGLFGNTVGDLGDSDVQIVQALADVAAISVLQERTIQRAEILTEQLQGALNSRIVIEQAKGAIAQTHGISVDAAFQMIRGYARRTNRRLGDVAQTVVTDLASLPELAAPGSR
ncbi:GAF domain-containing protein [Actinoplanes lutulentus]|uniref:Response regulator receiver and ANTAR domain protein n=1 Tax=Actinoplanes lutulentus TaxID=1287878 RepID=A0A327ZAC5_9ACTN|nr:GAF and ANTAR domain-containing protein [Actinoplanes lutulentus]MBB2947342.1 GAF domain-containing protein [Actinoplanes lutulentus]RAK36617.1 response regulator receiver and ANTAR domain protein [Actinoplanes lutulentus]